jgi:hypothetical protein
MGYMSFRRMQWLFPFAVAIHNSEEAVFMPSWVSHHAGQIPLHPSAEAIRGGLVLLTLGAFAITTLSARRGRRSIWAYLLFGYIAAMLINVFVPHIPATLISRSYTPGVVTAVLINLPVMSILLLLAVRDQWVSGGKATVSALLVPLAIGASILVLFTLA